MKTKQRNNKSRGIEAIKSRYGYFFVAPWLFGVVVFLVAPLFASLYYSFSNVSMTAEGLTPIFAGLKWYKYALLEDPDYIDLVVTSISQLFTSLPIILAVSLLLALVLNQEFRGRMFARAVFFLPVIISSGVVMTVLSEFTMTEGLTDSLGGSSGASSVMQAIDFEEILSGLQLPGIVNTLMTGYLSDLFNLLWSCGVQILLFVAGLQTIPAQLYEVSKVEGASSWEEFWYITVPMLGNTILLVGFYTMIELFVENCALVKKAAGYFREQVYDRSSAMLWLFFVVVGLVMAIVFLFYKKFCLNKWSDE